MNGIDDVAADIRFAADLSAQIFQKAPDAMIIVAAETGVIRLVNDQAEFLTGYHRSELRGKVVDVLVPASRRGSHLAYREGYASDPQVRQMSTHLDLVLLTKSGREVQVDIMLSPVATAGGIFVIATIRRKDGSHDE